MGELVDSVSSLVTASPHVVLTLAVLVGVAAWGWFEWRMHLRKLGGAGRLVSIAKVERWLAEGVGTLVYDGYDDQWWWTEKDVRVPAREWTVAHTRDEAEAIVRDLEAIHQLSVSCCSFSNGNGRLVVGPRKVIRGVAERRPERVAILPGWALDCPARGWEDWLVEPRCKQCGYDLAGLDAALTCPECGGARSCRAGPNA